MDQKNVIVSRPTFAELVTAIQRGGLQDALQEDGSIVLGSAVFVSASPEDTHKGRCARVAAQIADAATPGLEGPCYDDGRIRILTRCKADGVHLIRTNGHDSTSMTSIIPRAALFATAAELIDCMGRPAIDGEAPA